MKLRLLLILAALIIIPACSSAQPPSPFNLNSTSWTLTSITVDGKTITPPAGSKITLVIAADGKVSGNSGCNQYNSNVVTQGEIIRFSNFQSTLMACVETERMEFEGEYLTRLFQGQLFEKKNGQLTITFADGAGRLVFTGS